MVAGRGLLTVWGVGIEAGEDHMPSPTDSAFIDISFGFMVTGGA